MGCKPQSSKPQHAAKSTLIKWNEIYGKAYAWLFGVLSVAERG